MMKSTEETGSSRVFLRDMGDGLVLRSATPADTDAVAALNAEVFREPGTNELGEGLAAWTRDLMRGNHPTVSAGDVLVVEDTEAGRLVSTVSVISQRWQYGSVEFGVGRPEMVATLPEYRNRGLVRAQFEVFHGWSAERGEMVQAITGIPYYYRQFGYEMAMSLEGARLGYPPHVPPLKEEEQEPYRIRLATDEDIPFIGSTYTHGSQRSMVRCPRDEAMWRYELHGREEASVKNIQLCVIETAEGEAIGILSHYRQLWGPTLTCNLYELIPGISWGEVTQSVVRYLAATGKEYAAKREKGHEWGAFAFVLGSDHPVYSAFRSSLPRIWEGYAWYMRVADLRGFLAHIKPVLEGRLAGSIMSGYTGELKINMYRDGIALTFDKGEVTEVAKWKPSGDERVGVAFPDLTFLQMLFGYRSFDDLKYAFTDCQVYSDDARELVSVLFPKQLVEVWPVA